ncbi:phage antirepressor KilAC domain-containing protein [Streptococcus pyogenes]|uniref:Antirepressor-phage associated n=1 Tax=Streptococcus pyogenes serotype M1 TaxID=301447 RepID=Q9A012_STRP1|nr:phage antirepressor KilAC domain-containing protein [Streptococcus pyogenes]ESU89863.1 BRO family, N-terminal domain protein [Streptococcus pyogenes GA03455]QBX19534.1 putative antirepressor [Streptococcus phage Javan489]QBX28242.1 putative antirepressor [Streptococcus phage Javan446]QBX28412.1 putative antirepressor [Streptococcus phage Javan452]HER4552857.1 phage antirepressor KilAC domain-containing protein [Streptococcus pyogenes NGAS664]
MELQVFTNEQFGEVRTATINNQIYFNLNDCCQILELSNPRKTIERLNKDGVTTSDIIDSLGRTQQANFINESNFYKLVFQSRKPEAEKFADWVTSEVLPSIRKHGAYMTEQTLEQALTSPDFLIRLANELKEEKERSRQLEAEKSILSVENMVMKPKADYFDDLVDRNLLTSFRETAKQLKVKERRFIQFLLDKKYVYRDKKGKLMPFADKNNGLFEVKESVNEKTNWAGTQTLITPKGRETFRLLFI